MAHILQPSRHSMRLGLCKWYAFMSLTLLLSAALAAEDDFWAQKGITLSDERLLRWVEENGGKADGVVIGKTCEMCPRGTFATKNFKQGEEMAYIPLNATIIVDNANKTHEPTAATSAYLLFKGWYLSPGFNATYAPYLETLPAADGVFTPEMWNEDHMEMLQNDGLAATARSRQSVTWDIYRGAHDLPSVNTLLEPDHKVSWEQFLYGTALVNTRQFSFRFPDDSIGASMVPLMDMSNHVVHGNGEVIQKGQGFALMAETFIAKGEEVFHNYIEAAMHRSDLSLLIYGFVEEMESPLLAASDLEGADAVDGDTVTPESDADIYTGSAEELQKRRQRLVLIWASFPTTEREDLELLEGGGITDWRLASIVRSRIERKKALRQAISRLQALLASPLPPPLPASSPAE